MDALTEAEIKELDRLHGIVFERTRRNNSIITSMEISQMRREGDLDLMRFFASFWVDGIMTPTVHAAYEASLALRQDPNRFVTEAHVKALQLFNAHVEGNNHYVSYEEKMDMLTRMGMLLMSYPEREEYISALVLDRDIVDPDEIAKMLDNAEDMPRPLTTGTL